MFSAGTKNHMLSSVGITIFKSEKYKGAQYHRREPQLSPNVDSLRQKAGSEDGAFVKSYNSSSNCNGSEKNLSPGIELEHERLDGGWYSQLRPPR
mgnify:CR=1 FL=1